MSEDAHSSDNSMTPEDFERWKIEAQKEMLKAAKLLRSWSYGEGINSVPPPNVVEGLKSLKRKPGIPEWQPKTHLGRWEELTIEDFKFLYECGVSCE